MGADGAWMIEVGASSSIRSMCLRLAYDGTRFSGWQAQPSRRTVQGVLAEAIYEISGETVLPRGCSRTDAGVHALSQIVTFSTRRGFPPDVWVKALNAKLPSDVTVINGAEVAEDFSPMRAAVRKTYRYRIHDAPWRPVLQRSFVWRWKKRLNEKLMQKAASFLVGENDFTSFETTSSTRRSKVRTIYRIDVVRKPAEDAFLDSEVWIEVEGNGFLYNMVRIIAGSLVMIGCEKRQPDWMREALVARHRSATGPTAPPHGLILLTVELDPEPPWPVCLHKSVT